MEREFEYFGMILLGGYTLVMLGLLITESIRERNKKRR